jgi:predicted RNA polymerase sigma factor
MSSTIKTATFSVVYLDDLLEVDAFEDVAEDAVELVLNRWPHNATPFPAYINARFVMDAVRNGLPETDECAAYVLTVSARVSNLPLGCYVDLS